MLRSETAANPARMAKALAGVKRYQQAPRPAQPPPMPVVAEAHGACVRDYGGSGPAVLFVPSLINPPAVLDMPGDRSLLRWLAGQGPRVLLLDWGEDAARRSGMHVAAHAAEIAAPLARETGAAALVGYCLGGTIATGAAALLPAARLATIAAPWHFAGYPDADRDRLLALWTQAKPLAERLGVLPMEVLQSAFWSLHPARTVAKFEAFADLDPASSEAAGFVALEDWANDGPPIPFAAARELFEDFLKRDLTGTGAWQVGGAPVDRAADLAILSTSDRIVPATTAAPAASRIALSQGHVGMVVGGRARAALWEPLAAWLRG